MSSIVIHHQPEYRAELQEKAGRLPKALSELDFEDLNQVIWFLQEIERTGWVGIDPVPGLMTTFVVHGLYPGVNIGSYDPSDEQSFALYIIGRAKDDIVHVLAKEWRERFNKPQPLPL